ncbi:MAG: hypothetical protein ABIO39_12610 [Caulobacteraceae bacterium]
MESSNADDARDEPSESQFALRFTPAEWRHVLEDPSFLADRDNSYRAPRRLMGVPVEIVPDHSFIEGVAPIGTKPS